MPGRRSRPRGKVGGARQALVPATPAGSAAARGAPLAPGLHACERLEEPARERTASASPAQRLGRRSRRSGDDCRVGLLGPAPSLARPPPAAAAAAAASRGRPPALSPAEFRAPSPAAPPRPAPRRPAAPGWLALRLPPAQPPAAAGQEHWAACEHHAASARATGEFSLFLETPGVPRPPLGVSERSLGEEPTAGRTVEEMPGSQL